MGYAWGSAPFWAVCRGNVSWLGEVFSLEFFVAEDLKLLKILSSFLVGVRNLKWMLVCRFLVKVKVKVVKV